MIGVGEITQERLGRIKDDEKYYYPNERVVKAIGEKSLAPFIGPMLTGKSTLIDAIVQLDHRFGKVKSFSTRDPRPDDTPDTMECIPWREPDVRRICNVIDAGDGVQYTFHPTTGDIYGTTLDSYPKQYNLLPALSNSVESLLHLPFNDVRPIGLVVSPDEFTARKRERQFASASDLQKRLAEGAASLEWMLDNPDVAIFSNPDGQLAQTAKDVRKYILADGPDTLWNREEGVAKELLSHIKSLM